ncbi:MAG: sigma-70 family RNA polymerase sigma factor [Porphyromonadaceae bacterium]|nr:MAG: sigma-70 family RNA polymerase sigma factor [Porphyromonadaceae bacterium]
MVMVSDLSNKAKQDYALVQKARSGDQHAFAQLLSRYWDSVYFMILKMAHNKDDAEDLTIEAFGKAFKFIHNYEPDFAFSTWLFKIANNNAIDFLRKQHTKTISIDSQGRDADEDNPVQLQSDTPDPEEVLIHKQKTEFLKTIVKELKPRYSRLVQLRYFEEYSYEEIAETLSLPIGTVKAQLFRAKELLYHIIISKEV